MKKKTIALLFPVFLLPGCTMFEPMGPRSFPCNDQVCHVEVTVSSACQASVDQEMVKVGRNHPEVRFIWTIRGQGEFASNGIDVRGGAPFQGRLAGAKNYKWDFRNQGPSMRWKYDVNVTLNGRACPTLDPFIMN
jgi:hypothetical protein